MRDKDACKEGTLGWTLGWSDNFSAGRTSCSLNIYLRFNARISRPCCKTQACEEGLLPPSYNILFCNITNTNNNTPVTGIPLADLSVTPPASAPDASPPASAPDASPPASAPDTRPLASTVVTQPQPLLPISNEPRRVVETWSPFGFRFEGHPS